MKIVERYSILLHIIGWIVFITIPILTLPVSNVFSQPNFNIFVLPQIFSTTLLIAIFYLNLNYFTPNLLIKKNTKTFVFYLFAGLIVLAILNSVIFELVFKPNFPKFPMPKRPPPPPSFQRQGSPVMFWIFRFFATGISYVLVIFASSMLALVRERIRSHDEKQQIILEKTAAELAVLKLQISPHFLFNTLNNIRWLARQKSERTEDSVVKLSQLLRYMIYQSSNDKVSLEQEIEHLHHYIDLQKMRLTDKHTVEFVCEGHTNGILIEPLLFIPFVENAFKYGLHHQEKSLIRIEIKAIENTLCFYSENDIFESNMPEETGDSGIGIQNVKRRLILHYPALHELNINSNNCKFIIDLKIQVA
ncbi:sensor histidine kinase [Emticicia sp. SJ17W-69]|uniref:sensor histidine kinase n=1 Tax=Emticicia sp. SJ17W-69 TaxID=3421657 RepID=UPI003EBBB0F3